MEGERMLTVAQVAEQLQVPAKTVRRWIGEGRLSGVMLGGRRTGYRIRQSAVEAFIRGEGPGEIEAAA